MLISNIWRNRINAKFYYPCMFPLVLCMTIIKQSIRFVGAIFPFDVITLSLPQKCKECYPCPVMGYYAPFHVHGIYDMDTSKDPPYCPR